MCLQSEYDELADSLKEECFDAVQKIVDEACELFTPLVCHKWLSWGRDILFLDLAAQVQWEEELAAAAKAKAEAEATEAKAWAEAEAAKVKQWVDKEEAKWQAAVAKAAKLEG